MGIDIFEFLYFPKLSKKTFPSLVTFTNHNQVAESIRQGKGTFILSGHISNWELMAFAYPVIHNESLKLITKIQANKKLNKRLNEFRQISGNEIIEIGYSLRKVFAELNRNSIICFLVDQSANPDYSVYVKFFGQRAATFSGPAKIALKQRPGLILAYGIRNANYTYNINFEKIEYDDLTDYNDENIIELTQRIQSRFEEIIKAYPDQWLWFHKRFKHVKNEDE